MKASARMLIMFAVLMSPVCASSEVHTVTCGSMIDIAAEPFEGYHFVQWADGSTDALRTIEVNKEMFFTAIFAPDCRTYEDVPVAAISHNMYVVQLHQLAKKGYYAYPENVSWYKVVGEIDNPADLSKRDDHQVRSGIELQLADSPENAGVYYAEVDVATNYAGQYCGDVLRSDFLHFTPLETVSYPIIFPTVTPPGQTITITGLPRGENVDVYVYDYAGRLLSGPHSSNGETFVQLYAPLVGGVYLLWLRADKVSQSLRIFVAN